MDKHAFNQLWPHTYAQHGDDIYLANIFKLIGIDKPSYLDIGCNHPYHNSNTALFYEMGCRGMNVDANPNVMSWLEEHRHEDKNIWMGICDNSEITEREFYLVDATSGLNSFDKDHIEHFSGHKIREKKMISTMNINFLIEYYFSGNWPDLLSVDIEGLDYPVLRSANFSSKRPKVIIAEIRKDQALATTALLMEYYFCYARVQANLIFVEHEYREKLY